LEMVWAIRMGGNHPKESIQHSVHGESLKSRFFYVVRHLDSIASHLPTGLHLGFFRSWPSLFLPSSFSSVFEI
jgi:hypothetical protein